MKLSMPPPCHRLRQPGRPERIPAPEGRLQYLSVLSRTPVAWDDQPPPEHLLPAPGFTTASQACSSRVSAEQQPGPDGFVQQLFSSAGPELFRLVLVVLFTAADACTQTASLLPEQFSGQMDALGGRVNS